MKKQDIIKEILARAKQDEKNRQDPRFLDTMGFLVAKGFLRVNFKVPHVPNKRINVEDAIWAGENVEPRILEVLPAAILRLERHFYFTHDKHADLILVVDQLRKNLDQGQNFLEVPYEKLKAWRDLPLLDGRTKTMKEKKVTKTFRLKPEVIAYLAKMAKKYGCTETTFLETQILKG